jgi:predicted CoA-binding protein
MKSPQTVAVLGASDKPDRYSNMAVRMLLEYGHQVIPIHPALPEIEGLKVAANLGAISTPVDTLTLYVAAERLEPLIPEILRLRPGRVIFNPGTESIAVQTALDAVGIPWQEACTLVLLRTGQFAK